jgi:hypothetical protein
VWKRTLGEQADARVGAEEGSVDGFEYGGGSTRFRSITNPVAINSQLALRHFVGLAGVGVAHRGVDTSDGTPKNAEPVRRFVDGR